MQNATVKLVMMTSQNHMSEYALLELVKISVLMNVYIQKKMQICVLLSAIINLDYRYIYILWH